MDDPTASPPPLHTKVSSKHEKSLPPSPPPSFSGRSHNSSSKSRSTSPSKRHHHHHHHHRTKDLLHLLSSSQSTSDSLEHQLTLLSSQLAFEQDRADTAERRLRDTLVHIKQTHDARVQAQTDLARVSEELGLYKRALEEAQKEIFRAQEVVRDVEARRRDVEEEAASLRRQLRKMNQEKMLAMAREEGRKVGLQEGLEMGQDIGYLKGRNKGYVNGRMVSGRVMERYSEHLDDTDADGHDPTSESEPPYTATTMRYPSEHDDVHDTPTPAQPPRQHPSVRTTMYSPAHAHIDIPPDGWIPEADSASHIIRLPPPHELARPLPTPGAPSPPPPLAVDTSTSSSGSSSSPPLRIPVAGDVPVLMIPEPKSPRGSLLYDLSSERRRPQPHMRAHAQKVHRRSSRDSIGTTTTTRTSELDLLNAPEYVRGGGGTWEGGRRMSGLSAIPEVVSLQETTVSSGSSSGRLEEDRVDEAGFVHVSMPAPRTPNTSKTSKPKSTSPNPSFLSVDQQRSPSRPNSASSFGTVNITVQPPSRPASNISQAPSTRPNLLSPADADRPIPLPSSLPHQTPSVGGGDGDLPPGFVPTTGTVSGTHYTGMSVPLPVRDDMATTPAVIPPPSSSAHYPLSSSSRRDRDGGRDGGVEDDSDSVSSSDVGTLTTPPLGGAARYRVPGSHVSVSAKSGYTAHTGYTASRVPLPPPSSFSSASMMYTPYTAAGVSLPPSGVSDGVAGTPYSYASRGGKRGVGSEAGGAYVNLYAGVTPGAGGRTRVVDGEEGM